MTKAQEAVNYLRASPAKFLPALNNLSKSIQKIDPLTGKLMEGFKKAHDVLKQWSNVTFNQLANRIPKLRKAVEEGFINENALKAEFEEVSKQVKLQVATEMEPMRGQFKTEEAFNATVASEYFSKMGEIGGKAFVEAAQKEFRNIRGGASSGITYDVAKGSYVYYESIEKNSDVKRGVVEFQNFK